VPRIVRGALREAEGDERLHSYLVRAAAERSLATAGTMHDVLGLGEQKRAQGDVLVLRQVDRAELALKALGYPVVRVRHYGDLGRVEIAADDLSRALAERSEVEQAVRAAGYAEAEIDERPFRSGSLNRQFAKRLPVLGA
jgi:hypothetical protein